MAILGSGHLHLDMERKSGIGAVDNAVSTGMSVTSPWTPHRRHFNAAIASWSWRPVNSLRSFPVPGRAGWTSRPPHLPSTGNCAPMNPVPVRSATRTQRANIQPVEHPLEISLSRCAHLLQSRDGGEARRRDKMRCSDEGTYIACVPWEHGEAHLHPVFICIPIGICIPVRHHQTEVLPPPRVHPSSGMSWVTRRPSTVDSSRLINLQLGGDRPYARRKLQVPLHPASGKRPWFVETRLSRFLSLALSFSSPELPHFLDSGCAWPLLFGTTELMTLTANQTKPPVAKPTHYSTPRTEDPPLRLPDLFYLFLPHLPLSPPPALFPPLSLQLTTNLDRQPLPVCLFEFRVAESPISKQLSRSLAGPMIVSLAQQHC
ncbi:hypothetical protein CH63R_10681 [Colletotrichum higginsianum IMI 349063]|uniref:Uncharacterized protein n=1 Tax=Colletotrichum higginsianum (strain IMI 349063) TaxID=759273 RepID=A0A1B7Y3H5_COLHI|nr:uncharacterized protein CH63R_10681 [Colletotrichum higginsianum IMI 349063]OBR06561.1 hypothetical protein CH63R_10681 [Colletotrichum higginsianum IMI 349063]